MTAGSNPASCPGNSNSVGRAPGQLKWPAGRWFESTLFPLDPRELGAKCDTCPFNQGKPVPPSPASNPKLFILGEAPTGQDTKAGKCFGSGAGKVLDAILAKSGVRRSEVHLSNTVLCTPPSSARLKQWTQAIRCCAPRLEKEVAEYPGKYVLAYGGHALRVLTKFPSILGSKSSPGWMGYPLPITAWRKNEAIRGKEVLPTLSPGYTFTQPQYKEVVAIHTHRALMFASGQAKVHEWSPFIPPSADEAQVLAALKEMESAPVIGTDTETAGLSFMADLNEIALSTGKLRLVVHWPTATPAIMEGVRRVLAAPSLKLIHNAAFDLMVFSHNDIPIGGKLWDTLIAARMLRPGVAAGLDTLAVIELVVERWKSIFKQLGGKWDDDEYAVERAEYASKDADVLAPIYTKQLHAFSKSPLKLKRFLDLMEDFPLAARMKAKGIALDQEQHDLLAKDLQERTTKAAVDLSAFATQVGLEGYKIGSASPKALFKAVGASSAKLTAKTGQESFDATVVGELLESPVPLIREAATKHLTYKKLSKYYDSQVGNLSIDTDNAVHPDWNPAGAKTSRWAVSDPNVNQLARPRSFHKGDLDIDLPYMKKMFRARPGKWLVSADWKQAEARVAAVISGDEPSIAAFERGEDIHTLNGIILAGGENVWASLPDDKRKAARHVAKTYLFGRILYGGGISTVWSQAVKEVPTLTQADIAGAEALFMKAHPALKVWRDEQLRKCKFQGFVDCPFDPSVRLVFKEDITGNWLTQSLNFPIQSSVAWWMRSTMHLVAARCDWTRVSLLAQIYDCLLLECDDPDEGVSILRETMGRPWVYNNRVIPMDMDCEVGVNWGEMEKVK